MALGLEDELMQESKDTRVFLVDCYPVVRMGLSVFLEKQRGLTVSGESASGGGVVEALGKCSTDVLVTGLSLGDMNGLELVKQVRGEYPDLPILVFSIHDEKIFAQRALRAGANGYLMKNTPLEELVEAIRQISRAEVALSKRQSDELVKRMFGVSKNPDSPLSCLSNRELEVFEFLGRGVRAREIAERLFISKKTVEAHLAHIKRKLDLKNQVELLRVAFGWINDLEPRA